ncbi:hypothetical protein LX32DRAFT_380173 [Colletotrichum zoysiae]|uniref:Uncharacterized protein n=1 Tax=Colletotrichum zoysiae TaxID=1216348 RepID=A0AAD9HGW0_9PEZI|nr:hypothetical protein LX32DRAFT_380173 [Colletotrichum zoysiae]
MNYIQPPGDVLNASCPSPPCPPLPSMRTSLLLEVMPRPRPIATREIPDGPLAGCDVVGRGVHIVGFQGFVSLPVHLFLLLSRPSYSSSSSSSYVPRSGPPLWTPFVIRKRPLTLCLPNLRVVPLFHIHAHARTRTHKNRKNLGYFVCRLLVHCIKWVMVHDVRDILLTNATVLWHLPRRPPHFLSTTTTTTTHVRHPGSKQ